MQRIHDPIAENLAQLVKRRDYIALLDERHGPNRGRALEAAAVCWALDELSALFPEAVDPALEIVAAQKRWRAERDAAAGPRE